MYKIKEAVIVEGVYDKIKLSGFLDGIIFTTSGFGVFSNKDKLKTIKSLAKKTGIVIFTDSDSAGFKIRNFVKQHIPEEYIKHAYIPDISGKEKRKTKASKEGLLGVEGISEDIIIDALKKSGCEINGEKQAPKVTQTITKADLFALGLSGGNESAEKRHTLAKALDMPSKISANMLLSVLNRLLTLEELQKLTDDLFTS